MAEDLSLPDVGALASKLDGAVSKADSVADLADKYAEVAGEFAGDIPGAGPEVQSVVGLFTKFTHALDELNAALQRA